MFTPSRPAPLPCSSRSNQMPPQHPFATHYIPTAHHNPSVASLTSLETGLRSSDTPKRTTSPASTYSSAASNYSTASGDYRSYLLPNPRSSASPTGSLASPLTPGRPRLTTSHFSAPPSTATPHASHPASRTGNRPPRSTTAPAYSTIPSNLAILDRRPRQDLLGDLEFIAGKKLRFPFLRRWRGDEDGKKEKRALKKERRGSQEDEFGWEVEQLLDLGGMGEKHASARSGRGVREGNWI